MELREAIDPATTALVLQECQNGVIGELSALPALAEAAKEGLIPNVAALATAARTTGVRVIHCTAQHRADGWGGNRNARLFRAMPKMPVQLHVGTPAVEVVPEIGVADADIVLPRHHGLSPFEGTELNSLLRNEGVRTIVAVGVSVNVAIINLTFDAVNAGYVVVIPRDAVAGTPPDYVDAVFEHTLGIVATVTTTNDVVDAWAV
ncbi:MAG: cysteine hydrolase, partial [Acidimicrobiia bacterium]|nr:cysteine hydrolase [Acidimicrobiia bacterium]MYB08927.1 cysteine hydrolase [Acidimicrobiia bacterium]MYG57354.1 cysteine hydrolase [Acidimicrobiia bacterium]MYG71029.1 cysteine hydrolase [Acidimicrobiia bacterium]MYH95658.1 cysteine hydrolase [Acidimicrobiia bacterium]